jgi:drug/metabolite transporter (DMT)-like permease
VKRQHVLLLFLLAALWGGSFLFIRIAAPVFGPAMMVELRVLIAGACLLGWSALQRRRLPLVVPWPRFLLLGLLNAAIPFGLISAAELTLPAATAAILNATTPLFTALGAAVFLSERLTPRKVAGVLLGIAGVGILVGFHFGARAEVVAASLSLFAAMFYAVGGIYGKRAFPGVPAHSLATYQQIAAAVAMLPLAVWLRPQGTPDAVAVISLVVLAVACTAVAYLIYFRLLTEAGPTFTLSVTFLVPVFGTLWGWIFLGERIGLFAAVGLAVILLSVALVTDIQAGRRLAASSDAMPGR